MQETMKNQLIARWRRSSGILAVVLPSLIGGVILWAQNSKPSQPPGCCRHRTCEAVSDGARWYRIGFLPHGANRRDLKCCLFQTGTPLFKQIPGTEYAWHEVVVMIAPDGNHKAAQEKLVAAVNAVYAPYREEIERQHADIERRVDIQVEAPARRRAFSLPTPAWNCWSAIR